MARQRIATVNQINDAVDTMQKVLESDTYRLTRAERLAIMDAKRAMKVLAELKKEGK